jgi:hypothetical protein
LVTTSTSAPCASTVRLRRQDRTGRLDREAHDHVLARGDAAEDAAGLVGEETAVASPMRISSALLLARHGRGGEAGADLHPLTALIDIIALARSASSLS